MDGILKKLDLGILIEIFAIENVTSDIISTLSLAEFEQLGITDHSIIMRLRVECSVYGSIQPQRFQGNTRGTPKFYVPKRILKGFIDDGFLILEISNLLSISERTVYRRMSEYGLSKRKFTDISESDLNMEVLKAIKELPSSGEVMLREQLLREKGLNITRSSLRESLHNVDEQGIYERSRRRLRRCTYDVKGPNHLWHIDTNHKLVRWYFIVTGVSLSGPE